MCISLELDNIMPGADLFNGHRNHARMLVREHHFL